jgi:hypothetical protein
MRVDPTTFTQTSGNVKEKRNGFSWAIADRTILKWESEDLSIYRSRGKCFHDILSLERWKFGIIAGNPLPTDPLPVPTLGTIKIG